MLAQVSPGPLAAQLCFYLAYVAGGWSGAALSAAGFVLPSFVMVLWIGWAYVRYGGLPQIRAVFNGVGAAVTGLLVYSGWRLIRKTVAGDWLLQSLLVITALVTVGTGTEPVVLIVAAGVTAWLVRAPPAWLRRRGVVADGGSILLLLQIAGFFTYAGAFVFGSGLAIVPFLHGGLVVTRGWLDETRFLDAVAVALITPGPVVITTGFIGYLLAGFSGGFVAAAATFLPCFVITLLLAPHVRRFSGSRGMLAGAAGITAAATGALAGAVVLIGRQAIHDPLTGGVALAAWSAAWWGRIPGAALVMASALIGLVAG